MPFNQYPIVPNVPGVPPILRKAGAVVNTVELLVSDALFFLGLFLKGPQWGIFRGRSPVVVADSVVDMSYRQDWSLADFPIEDGGFQSYDKVQNPFEARLRFTAGGTTANREQLLTSVDATANSTEVFSAVTPEKTYPSVSVIHYDFHREARRGLGLLTVDVWVQEVRVAPAPAFSNTKSATSADPINAGIAQTRSMTPEEAALWGAG